MFRAFRNKKKVSESGLVTFRVIHLSPLFHYLETVCQKGSEISLKFLEIHSCGVMFVKIRSCSHECIP